MQLYLRNTAEAVRKGETLRRKEGKQEKCEGSK
jgi:hypothetical protein